LATAGIVLGIVGLVGAVFWFVLLAVAVHNIDNNNCFNNPSSQNCGINTGSTGNTLGASGSTVHAFF
jgi:hypothetical protein